MKDKDKEVFEKWFNDERREFEANEPATYTDSDEWCMKKGWQAACDYKQKEIEELKDNSLHFLIIERFMTYNEKLQAENSKLKECVKFYSDYRNDSPNNEYNNELARQVLKDVGEE